MAVLSAPHPGPTGLTMCGDCNTQKKAPTCPEGLGVLQVVQQPAGRGHQHRHTLQSTHGRGMTERQPHECD